MKARDLMTAQPKLCSPETTLRDVARMMVEQDCGSIPVAESDSSRKLIGMITDRDIACRAVAQGKSPTETRVSDVMSTPCVTVHLDASVQDCCDVLEKHQIRRVPVVDENGMCCGIVAQADLARKSADQAAEVVREVSQPTDDASRVH